MGRFAEALEDVQRLVKGDCRGVILDTMLISDVPVFTPEEIKALRHSAKMSQSIFARCIGVTRKTVDSWEKGRSQPESVARRLLGLLQMDPEFFCKSGIISHKRTAYTSSLVHPKTKRLVKE